MTTAQANTYYESYRRLYNAMVVKFQPMVERALRAQVKVFTDAYKENQSTPVSVIPSSIIKKSLTQIHITAGVNGGKLAEKEINKQLKADDDAVSRWSYVIDQYLEANGLANLAIEITNTLRKNILKVLQQGNKEGWGVDKMVRQLNDAKFPRWMATRIVRTETNKAANTGAMIAATDAGIEMKKRWISAQDNRTRRIPRNQTDHLHMNGVEVGMNERFIVPGTKSVDAMLYPGDPDASAANNCNCRCRVVFIPQRNAEGVPIPNKSNGGNPFYILLEQARAVGRGIRDFVRNLFKSHTQLEIQ